MTAVAAVAVLLVAGAAAFAWWLVAGRHAPASIAGPRHAASSIPPASAAGTPAATRSAEATAPVSPPSASGGIDVVGAVRADALPYPNTPPVTPASFSHVTTSKKLVAITLDDGIPFNTKILDLFEKRGTKATTFVLGEFAARRPELLKRLRDDGFEIANHTYSHPNLAKLSDAEIRSQLSRTQAAISKVTGNQAPYLRPPGGATNSRVKRVAAEMGYKIVLWDKTFADTSKYATPDKLFHNVMDGLKPGDIILCHWGGKSTYEALQLILPEMERRGFTPVPISVLLKYKTGASGEATSAAGH
jgi:peptidoglycan/xylan/chitin deacetylase (PgdA/CDA1 family)